MDLEKVPDYEEQLKALEAAIANAEENYGDTEVREAIMNKAAFILKNGDDALAIKTYLLAYEKTVGVSKRLEIYMILLQIYFKETDLTQIKNYITKSKQLLEEGGDWENKNKLKVEAADQVYEGLYCLITRDFATCAKLFVDAMSTFSSPEIMTYEDLTFYTVVSGLMTLPRAEIKEKVGAAQQIINNSEVLCIIRENAHLEGLLTAYYKCQYKDFFVSFRSLRSISEGHGDDRPRQEDRGAQEVHREGDAGDDLQPVPGVLQDRHARVHGLAVRRVCQLPRQVRRPDRRELSGLISSRRLNCKIDKVTGLIESQRIDQRNNYYKQALKQGEGLLNRIQKLSRVGDV